MADVSFQIKHVAPFIALTLALLAYRSAEACSCFGPTEGLDKWTQGIVESSEHVFLGRITKVSDKPISKFAMFDSASVVVLQSFKGTAKLHGVDSNSLCQTFRLAVGETRVFFVDKNGIILGCTEYRSFANDKQMVEAIRRALQKNEN